MGSRSYLALLRGINVGGNNIIKMVALKACFEGMGFQDVITYIQSGNVVFSSPETNLKKLTNKIEKQLSKQFKYCSRVAIVSRDQLKTVVKDAPKGFGSEPMKYRYDVMFLLNPLTAREAIKQIPIQQGVDRVYAGKSVLYFSRLIARASQSKLPRVIQLPIYQQMTIRNWNTTTKLLALMEMK